MIGKKIPTELEYQGFLGKLRKDGYLKIGSKEEQRFLKKNNIDYFDAPRPQELRDDVYVFYTLNGYRVKVRTTISENPYRVAQSDQAWVMSENEKGEAVMFSAPFHRTENFLISLLQMARIFKYIALERPLCECGNNFIIRKKGLREYRYVCSHASIAIPHLDDQEVFDFILPKLPSDLRKFLRIYRSKQKYSARKADEAGKEFGASQKTRKRWKQKNK